VSDDKWYPSQPIYFPKRTPLVTLPQVNLDPEHINIPRLNVKYLKNHTVYPGNLPILEDAKLRSIRVCFEKAAYFARPKCGTGHIWKMNSRGKNTLDECHAGTDS